MKRSTERILTTHTGSLPRPPTLTDALARRERGERLDGELDALIRSGVIDVVHRQVDAGITVVNDGEAGKIRYATYVKERLDGFGGQNGHGVPSPDRDEFADYVDLAEIIDLVFEARPAAISFEAANQCHAHEWDLFEELKLPEGKTLIPDVLDSTTNYVEHPELVAQRILRYAALVGRENVIAGSDCGFATSAYSPTVFPTITWAKLRALAEGARIASARLWPS